MLKHARRALITAALAASAAGLPTLASSYPDSRITLVVPFAPGGTTDLVARLVAEALASKLSQTVLVENRPGAGTMLGASYVANAKPDGYTLLMASADSLTTGLAMRRKAPFDPFKDFTLLALLTVSPLVVSVNPNVHAGNLQDFAALAKTGAPLRYGSGGVGTIMHLTGEMLAIEIGANLLHVPYRGGSPAVADAIGGQIEALIVGPTSVQSQITAGQLRGLAQTGIARHPLLPQIPTAEESGYANFTSMSFFGVAAPAATPPSVAETLSRALMEIASSDEFKQKMINVGGQGNPLGPTEFANFVKRDLAKWRDVVAVGKIDLVD